MIDELSLRFLGPPEVRYQGQTLKFRSRKELALLVYLVVEGGVHSREKLIAFLWPDSDRQRGQASLRNTLVRLRQALGEAEFYLRVEPNVVSFDADRPFELDLDAVQRASQLLPETAKGVSPVDRSQLQAAIAVYRGDFLEGFSLADAPEFDSWASQQRETWQRHLERIFNRLSRLQFEAGQVDQAIDTTRQWLESDPLNEAAYRRLMQLYFLNGNRSAALNAFEQCCRLLADELGVEADAETLALAERIRTEAPRPSTPPPKATTLTLPPLELPFVGRSAEHSQLVAAYHAASQNEMQVVCLFGEAGIGKTRLTQTFLAWAVLQKADILTGRTFEAGGQLPYQPLVAALRERLERENAPDDLLADVWLSELSQLLPELRDRYPDLPPPVADDPSLARSRLFEAVAQLGQALARRMPVVIFIDDLQWADAATLEALPYLCRRWAKSQARVLLLLTLRHENLITTPGWRDWLAQLERDVSLNRLPLRALTADDTLELTQRLSGDLPNAKSWLVTAPSALKAAGPLDTRQASPSVRFSEYLYAETAGQPFFMAETIKMLVEQKFLHSAYLPDGRWAVNFESAIQRIQNQQPIPVPPNVREVILTRLGRLSETAGALLAAGAVLGRACSFERLCQVSGIEELEGLTALDELVKSQLLVEADDVQRPYLFAHDKIRDVVYTEAGDARRRVYHRRAFEGLQAESAPAAELAHHALAARLWEPAFRYGVAAGDAAAGLYAHAEAIAHYRRALEIARQAPAAISPEAVSQLYLRLGRTLELTSQHEQALNVYQELETLAHARGDGATELAALMARITPLATVTAVFDPAQAEALSEHALQLAQALGDQAAEAKILWNQLIVYRNTNRAAEAIVRGQRALALARQFNSSARLRQPPLDEPALRQQTAFILHDLGYAYSFKAEFQPAIDAFTEASGVWREFGNLPMLADSLTGLCLVCVFTGEYDAALAYFDEALRISETIDTVWALAGCRHNIGFVFADRGQVDRAISEMETSLRLSEQVGFISPLIVVRADLAALYGALGMAERGLEAARLAVDVAETKMPILRVYALAALAHIHTLQGRLAEAEAVIGLMKTDAHRDGWGLFRVLIPRAEAEVALAQCDHERARALAAEAAAAAHELGARALLPSALYLLGQAWLGLGQREAARERWREARAEAQAIGSRQRLWQIAWALAPLETDPREAGRLREQARESLTYIADHSPPELRAAFLGLPAVKAVYDDR